MTIPPMPTFWPATDGLLYIGPQAQELPTMASENFSAVMAQIFKHEGGYSDHARDPGGATMMGITIGVLSEHRGRSVTKAEVKALSKEEAMEIYRLRYWNKISGDELPPGVDLCVMDGAVNSGPSRGAKWLQRAIGVDPDGVIGNKTLAAADAADPAQTIERMCDDRMTFLRGLRTWSTFGTGWTRRVESVRSVALEMARSGPDTSAPIPAPRPPEPDAAPLPTTGGPTSKATGGAIGAGLPNVLLLLLVKLGAIPAEVASDPETILLLTTVLTVAGGWIGSYLAPKNAPST